MSSTTTTDAVSFRLDIVRHYLELLCRDAKYVGVPVGTAPGFWGWWQQFYDITGEAWRPDD